jgi:hypothetical protein
VIEGIKKGEFNGKIAVVCKTDKAVEGKLRIYLESDPSKTEYNIGVNHLKPPPSINSLAPPRPSSSNGNGSESNTAPPAADMFEPVREVPPVGTKLLLQVRSLARRPSAFPDFMPMVDMLLRGRACRRRSTTGRNAPSSALTRRFAFGLSHSVQLIPRMQPPRTGLATAAPHFSYCHSRHRCLPSGHGRSHLQKPIVEVDTRKGKVTLTVALKHLVGKKVESAPVTASDSKVPKVGQVHRLNAGMMHSFARGVRGRTKSPEVPVPKPGVCARADRQRPAAARCTVVVLHVAFVFTYRSSRSPAAIPS